MARKHLGQLLIETGAITGQELSAALHLQKTLQKKGERIGQTLLSMGAIDAERLAWALAEQIGAPLLNLNNIFIDPKVLQKFPRDRCATLRVFPVGVMEDALTVAMADPFDVVALDEVRMLADMPVRVAVATEHAILKAIVKFFTNDVALDEMVSRILPNLASDEDIEREEDEPTAQTPVEEYRRDADSRPVLRLVNSILRDAVNLRASDIHIEPMETSCLVRYRIDGLMRHMISLPMFLHPRTVCRIKVMAKMDIAEHRTPQDGRCRVRHQKNEIDLRVSTLPTQHGEKVVIRVLNPRDAQIRLDNMGLLPDAHQQIERMLRFPQGIILLTGPTGSGKTSTLYAMLHGLKSENFNIITLENPIEYDIPGVIQTQVHDRGGMSFAAGFRSILRQDPDVIMVGEIRDAETADIAFNAAMTGHLVLSTLHTNDACSAPVRLAELGISPYLITAALKGVISQRLVRRLCMHCRQGYLPDEEICKQLGLNPREPVVLYKAVGCNLCGSRGYSGRVGAFEILTLSEKMKDMMFQGGFNVAQMTDQAARDGMRDLMEDATMKVIQGVTSLEEAMRVVPLEERKGLCPQCQHRVERYFQTCPFCSFHLWKNMCRICGKELEEGWNFCPYCAYRPQVPASDGPMSGDTLRPPPLPVPSEVPETAPSRCRSCGMTLKANWEDCPLCLNRRQKEDSRHDLRTEPVPPAPVPSSSPTWPTAPTGPALSRSGRPVLVALIDDPTLLILVRQEAQEAGFHLTLSSGADAPRRVDSVKPVGILVEADLPGVDTLALCRTLRARPGLLDLPIVLVATSHTPVPADVLSVHLPCQPGDLVAPFKNARSAGVP